MVKYCPENTAKRRQSGLGKRTALVRQCALPVLVVTLLASCSNSDENAGVNPGQIDYLSGFIGGVVADEPRAALIGRDILSAGGSAADAVTAAALTLAVTYPNGAALGGGGICVVGDAARKRAETIEFPAVAAKAGGPIAVPGMVRGLGLLQGRYGRLRWAQTVAPAEQIARFGDGASRAFIQATQQSQPPAAGDPALQTVIGGQNGILAEGERRTQPKLAAVLARLRGAGPADFYQGGLSQTLLSDIAAAGGRITEEELRSYAADIGKPLKLPFENSVELYTSNNAGGGAIAAWLIEQSYDGGSLIGTAKFQPEKFVAALGQAYRGTTAAPQEGYGSSSIAAIDRNGLSVACAFSMGTDFGARKVGRETGVLFASPYGVPGDETPYLTVLVGINPRVNQSFFAAGAAGGPTAAAALAESVLRAGLTRVEKGAASVALAAPRQFQAGPQAPLLYEPGTDPEVLNAIGSRGITATQSGPIGRVNLAYCSNGVPRAPETCSFAADRRGYGLATGHLF